MKMAMLIACAFLVFSLSAGPVSVPLTYPAEVHSVVRKDMHDWAQRPPLAGANTCGTGIDCCPATVAAQQQCLDLAKAFQINPDFWARSTYVCIAQDPDWECDVYLEQDQLRMICETVPPTATVRIEDVARCAAKSAFVSF